MSDLDWKEVPQRRRLVERIAVADGGLCMRLALRQRKDHSLLELRVNGALRHKLEWKMGQRLGFSVGTGKMSGHLRFYRRFSGRKLTFRPNNEDMMFARFIAPSEWKALKGDLKIQDFFVEGGALVAKVAAVREDFFGESEAGFGPAGHEVAA
jgi:hypothetical protein